MMGQFWVEEYQKFDIDALIPQMTPATLNFDNTDTNQFITIDNKPLQ